MFLKSCKVHVAVKLAIWVKERDSNHMKNIIGANQYYDGV